MDDSWSRTDQRRANRVREDALARLSRDLCALTEKKLADLDLPEDLYDAVIGAQRMKSAPARNRQLGLVRALLRASEWIVIEKRVATLASGEGGSTANDELTRLETTWVMRLLGEAASGLEAFLREYPRADRTHLRQLVRNVNKSTDDRRAKAERRLREAVRSFLR